MNNDSAPERKQCFECGRMGTRGFVKHWSSGSYRCASFNACEERQYRSLWVQPDGVA